MMTRGLYVIFYKDGKVYAGKYYDFSKIGKSYFGSSGIAKQLHLEVAYIIKWRLPKGTTVEECDKKEKELIDYIAEIYGLHNLVKFRGDEEFYSRFPHNGRCINCHDRDSKGIRALKPIQLNMQAYQLYGVPYEEVTEEMRRDRHINQNKEWYANHKDDVRQYQEDNKEHIKEYNSRPEVKLAHSKNSMRCYHKNKSAYNKARNQRMTRQRSEAQEVFGFFEYIDVNDKKRKVSVGEIENKKLKYEPKRPEWKKYFFSDEYVKPEPKPKSVPRESREESVRIFGFASYTDVDGRIHEVSAEERRLGILAYEPQKDDIKHFYKPGIISIDKKKPEHRKSRSECISVFGRYTYVDVNNIRHEISAREAREKLLRFEPKDEDLKKFYKPT